MKNINQSLLFLDDSVHRQQEFSREYPNATIVSTAIEAISMLRSRSFSVVYLDHDLSGEIYVSSERQDTGMEVVRWIVENQPVIDKIVVHTMNEVAGPIMVNTLQQAGYKAKWLPFGFS